MSSVNKSRTKRWKETHRTKLKVRVVRNETFIVYVSPEMTVDELRKLLELSTGIPYDIQRLTYLDEAELIDTSTIKENEIVPGATIDLSVWYMWSEIVEKAIASEMSEIMKLGVDPSIPYSSPIIEYMDEKSKLAWIKRRAFVVLCIAAHREHLFLCQTILPFVPSLNTKTPIGRTVLHIAASQGNCTVIKLLIDKGAKMNIMDIDGFLAIDLAALFGRSDSERLITLLGWKDKMQKKAAPPVKKKRESSRSMKKEEEISEDIESEIESEIEEVPPAMVPILPSELVVVDQKETKPKDFAKAKTETEIEPEKLEKENIQQVEDKNQQPADYSKNPESFRRYLLNLKSESKHFGYAASIIDDHLQHLDDAKYHSFQRTVLASENELFD